jgi:kanamycin kinase
VKWAPPDSGLPLLDEAERLRWAARYVEVPRVIDAGPAFLHTTKLRGTSAVADRWKAEPRVAVRAIGDGLRQLHDTLPVDECPFSWSVDERRARMRAGAVLEEPPPIDRLVVCHADACAPNTLLDDDGRCSGHVDFGRMGVGYRWADIAIATWSTEWNYGPGWEDELLAAYGIEPDPERTRYYRLLWDLTP